MTVRFRAAMLGAILVLAILAVIPSSSANQGDPVWPSPITLDSTYVTGGTGVMTHGDGNVTVSECGNSGVIDDKNIETYDSEKNLIQKISGLTVAGLCQGRGTVGIDGTVFYTKTVSGQPRLTVVKNGVELASHTFSFSCGGTPYGQVLGSKIGTDGNLYAVISNGYSCSRANKLVSLDGQTGALRFSVDLTGGSEKYQSDDTIGVYDDGVVILEDAVNTANPDYLTYFDYSGTKNNTLSCAIHGSTDLCGFGGSLTGENISKMVVNSSGTAFIDAYSSGSAPCPTKKRTLRYDTSASATTPTRPSNCDNAYFIGLGASDTRFYSSSAAGVSAYDPSGSLLYSAFTNTKTGFTVYKSTINDGIMSGNGLFVTTRIASPSGSSDKFLYVDELQTNGTWTTLFSTQQFATGGTDTYDYMYAYNIPNVAFADDVMYVAYCSTTCTSGQTAKVVKVDSPGMTVEYPRSEIFAKYTLVNGEQLDYVALGDSFSSGEGVPPFISGTNTATVNECHRSPKAYPMLLDRDVDYDLNLRAFRACSGAKMENITTTGQWGEPKQLSSLNATTDLVTITIGGNDAEFTNVGFACNFDSGTNACMNQLNESNQIVTSQAFSDDLYDTLEAVENAAPNAGVIVNGYPYILSTPGVSTYCGWAVQAASQAEREAVEGLVDSLNSELSNAAVMLGMVYVDPRPSFDGHYPCFPTPYLNEADPVNHAYSYHPNEAGQAQYVTLLDEWLS